MKVVGKGRQLPEFDLVISEILLLLHVVDVSVLGVLHDDKEK